MSKFLKVFLIFIGIVVITILSIWGVEKYKEWKIGRAADQMVEYLNERRDEILKLQMADFYGGKTPQETLKLYIIAVEKGDFDLASKYFVLGNQEKERSSFIDANEDDLENYLLLLKKAIDQKGSYNKEKNFFSVENPLVVDFEKYPNGIWKIIEI